eukprot:gene4605-3298_t
MKTDYGPDCFLADCPSCRGECCCRRKTPMCPRKVHCYKKCPAVDRKIRTTSKSAAIQGSSEADATEQTKPSHDLPTDHSPSNHLPLDSIQSIFGYIDAESPHPNDESGSNLPKSKRRRVGPLLEEHVKDTLNPLSLRNSPLDSFPSTKWTEILSDLQRQFHDNMKEADLVAIPTLQFCHALDTTLSAPQPLPALKQLVHDHAANLFAVFPRLGSSTKHTADDCLTSPNIGPDNTALSFMTPDSSWMRLFSHPFAHTGVESSPLSLPVLQAGQHGTVATIPSHSATGSSTLVDSSPQRIDQLQTLLQNPLLLKSLPLTNANMISNSSVADGRSPGSNSKPTTDSPQQTTIQPPYTGDDHGSVPRNGWKPTSESFTALMRSIEDGSTMNTALMETEGYQNHRLIR